MKVDDVAHAVKIAVSAVVYGVGVGRTEKIGIEHPDARILAGGNPVASLSLVIISVHAIVDSDMEGAFVYVDWAFGRGTVKEGQLRA